MADSIVEPIDVNPEDVFQIFVDQMQARFPGWEPSDAHADTNVALAFAFIIAQLRETAADTTVEIFRREGADLHEIAPGAAIAASSTVTITMANTAGYTIDAGAVVGLEQTDGGLAEFVTTEDATITAGSSSVSGVPITATTAGTDYNDLAGAAKIVESDFAASIAAVVLDDPTSGGADAETIEDYTRRLAAELRMQAPRPILPRDFAQFAKRIPEVDSAAPLDGYNPSDGTWDNERMITIVPRSATGGTVSAGAKSDLADLFDTVREINFVVPIADPHITGVDVHATVVARKGWDKVELKTASEAAIAAFLNPANWGRSTFERETDEREWENDDKVRIGKLYDVLYDIEGLHHVEEITVGAEGGALAATDYTLPKTNAEPAPLPEPGAGILVTVL